MFSYFSKFGAILDAYVGHRFYQKDKGSLMAGLGTELWEIDQFGERERDRLTPWVLVES